MALDDSEARIEVNCHSFTAQVLSRRPFDKDSKRTVRLGEISIFVAYSDPGSVLPPLSTVRNLHLQYYSRVFIRNQIGKMTIH
jgi:hypothetical protein